MSLVRYMMRATLAIVLFLAGAPLSGSAQSGVALAPETTAYKFTVPALERPARLVVQDVALGDALARLYETSGVPVSFSPSLLPPHRVVSCDCDSVTISHALDRLLSKTGLQYREIDGHVLVYRVMQSEEIRPRIGIVQPRYALFDRAVEARTVQQIGTITRFARLHRKQQQAGSITGTVRDGSTLQPLGGAQVVLPELELGTLTQNSGRYLFPEVPVGTHRIEVHVIGYSTVSQEVTVAEGEVATIDFDLTVTAISLDEVVVTGVGIQEMRRRLGSSSAIVGSQTLEQTPAQNITQALYGQVAGVRLAPRGETGMSQPIRIRGGVSLTQRNHPLIYVDGVRVEGGVTPAYRLSVATSRLDDLNPNDIARIEVIKGAAAATLFGTEASSGVIQIFTKRGREGPPQYSFSIQQEALDFPPGRLWHTAGYDSSNHRIVTGTGAQDYMQTGHGQSYHLSMSGGSESIAYYVSGRAFAEDGYFPNQEVRNWSLQMNMDFDHTERFETSFGLNLRNNKTVFPVRLGWIGMHALSDPRAKSELSPYGETWAAFRGEGENTRNVQTVSSSTFNAKARYQWTPNITSQLLIGLDRGDHGLEGGVEDLPTLRRYVGGYRTLDKGETRAITADFHTAWQDQLTTAIDASLVLGAQSFWETRRGFFVDVSQFPAPGLSVIQAASNLRNTEEWWERVINAGVFGQAQLGFRDLLFITGGVRADGNSTFGDDFGVQFYPKAGISYVLSDASFWPSNGWWNTLRLRGAYGTSGLQPGTFDAMRSYRPQLGLDNVTFLEPANVGNPELRPERSVEWEIGADMAFFDDRLGLEVTHYWQNTVDAIMNRPLPASNGFLEPQIVNIGELESSGLELAGNWEALRSPRFGWSLRATVATLNQKVVDMGDIADFALGLGSRELNWVRVGYMPGANFGPVADPSNPYSLDVPLADLNSLDQIHLNLLKNSAGADSLVFLGNTQPSLSGSLSTEFRFPGGLALRAVFVGSRGFVVNSETMAIWWTDRVTPPAAQWEFELADPNTSAERKRQIVEEYVNVHPGTLASFLADGDHLRFHELSLSYRVPSSIAERLGLSDLTVELAASNLKLWLTDRYELLGIPSDPGQERGRSLAGSTTGHPNPSEVAQPIFLATDQWAHPAPRRLGITFRGTW